MNNKDIIGILLIVLAALATFFIVEPVGAELAVVRTLENAIISAKGKRECTSS